jgi:hypothetical protein
MQCLSGLAPACILKQEGSTAMGIIWTILIGFVVGLLAKMLTPGRDPSGFFITAVMAGRQWGSTRLANPRAFSARSSAQSFFW